MESLKTAKDVVKFCEERGVEMIHLWFVDILGQLKAVAITLRELGTALEEGVGVDGSSVEGFARIYESDLVAKPDVSTFQMLPWKVNGENVGRLICDIHNPDGSPYMGDTRYVMKRLVKKLAKDGYTAHLGPELEYFYFKSVKDRTLLDTAGYFDQVPDDIGTELRSRTVEALQAMEISVEASHHEVAHSQHEIDLRYAEALKMADQTITYRYVVKEIARQGGYYATFMPKPVHGQNGSGMHVHQSLFKNGKNVFFDAKDKHHLSKAGRSYLAGALAHMREITSVTNQWVNSYKRLVPGFEAPVYIAWGQRNRSALVRVPMYKPGKEKATRIELRCPDPACNPYLAFSLCIAAGVKGMESALTLRASVEDDIYEMNAAERKEHEIESLPGSLSEALELTAKSRLVKDTLGEHVFTKFIENKRIEWDNYRTWVTDYELNEYYPIL
ncbi:MAG TPA: glutamine synthetase family protein [Candidatus Eisenbacteria bacterium]|jgi:glutamine synthetase|nr:glutamine synthetase family protein [Candidatus Eisenbacteria bacterium]HZV90596.1 glutamine synthetase family protein [Candidatus Nitrosocosmicus sp.]